MENVIEARGIYKAYTLANTEVPILRGIDLSVGKGEIVALMGPSGSGKSTLLGILGGLDLPTSGRILIDGIDITKLPENKLAEIRGKKIGFVFQAYNLVPTLTAIENINLPSYFVKGNKKDPSELIEIVGLGHRKNNKPSEMSGGEQQRVAIARALINNPKILFGDEPTGNLDSKTETKILNLFQRLRNEFGTTIFLVTHSDEVAKIADRIIYIRDGKIREVSTHGSHL
ncbi:MAG: putative ABC transporter ATP-binding protein [Candidatus Methanofastidiosum methylothiophilum]|uniref:Putative ABC transporter ATP-binding protein n=1 Tax=Candidatus Methanofastidiosum methylothiophilum TaxID=1705564 RepID=A0A150J6X7_9EURY|nr:MAG: putative ABC transporter ATP-binding protein [Candidatus Methanofastidiosum methylthiophilus]